MSHWAETRSRSAPPLCLHDVGLDFGQRAFERSSLMPDSAFMNQFSTVEDIYRFHSRTTLLVDNAKILKLYSYLVDVAAIVANMNLARTKVPVPLVLDYGYSGNCAFIITELIEYCWPLSLYIETYTNNKIPSQVSRRMAQIVADLASLGLSHNDLHPRNVMVDAKCKVRAIIDWDESGSLYSGGEYARRIIFDYTPGQTVANTRVDQRWDPYFLRNAGDRMREELLIGVGASYSNDRIYRRPPLRRGLGNSCRVLFIHRSAVY